MDETIDLFRISTEILNFSIHKFQRFELILESDVEVEILRCLYWNVRR